MCVMEEVSVMEGVSMCNERGECNGESEFV